jgi:hypothetical protein
MTMSGQLARPRCSQSDCQRLSLGLLYPPDLFYSFVLGLLDVPVVPVNILVFLPATGRSVDTVSQIILARHQHHAVRITAHRTSLSLSADTSAHLNSAWPPLVPPRTGSNIFQTPSSQPATLDSTRAPGADDDRAWRGARLTGERLCKSIVYAERLGTCTLPESSAEALCILIWRRSYP